MTIPVFGTAGFEAAGLAAEGAGLVDDGAGFVPHLSGCRTKIEFRTFVPREQVNVGRITPAPCASCFLKGSS